MMADLWYCPKYGNELIGGFGDGPLAKESDASRLKDSLEEKGERLYIWLEKR